MSYQTGVPTNITDLFAQLKTFAQAHGFTLSGTSYSKTYNSSTYQFFALEMNGIYYGFAYHSTTGDLFLTTSTAWATATNLESQTGAPATNCRVTHIGTSPINYFFFTDDTCMHVAVERQTGVFAHFSFGEAVKHGSYTGGAFVSGSCWSSGTSGGYFYALNAIYHNRPFDNGTGTNYPGHIRATHGGNTTHAFGSASATTQGRCFIPEWDGRFVPQTPNTFNSRAVLFPINVLIANEDSDTPTSWVPVAKIPTAALVSIELLNPKDVILTDWMVFPISAKNSSNLSTDGYINSANYGIAYKK